VASLKGKILNYVFRNEENSYTIARIMTEDEAKITIVGYFPRLSDDVVYEFFGEWVNHPSYGDQFKIEGFKKTEIQSKQGLIDYLSSPLFTGIGPKTAKRIVEHFGNGAIEKIIANKTVLQEIALNPLRIERFYQELLENQTKEHILVELYNFQLTAKMAMKLINRYGMLTLTVLEENPYRLIDEVEGIGFIKADEIASKMGIQKDDKRRLKAALLYVMQNIAYQKGDLYLIDDQLKKQAIDMLELNYPLDDVIEELVREEKLILDENRYYLKDSYEAEISLADKINLLLSQDKDEYNPIDIEQILNFIQIEKNITYTNVQREAITTALLEPLSIITGGPGTGKTTIIDGIIDAYLRLNNLKRDHPNISSKIALMAPTGRAAKRMKEILDLDAKTIHRQLGFTYEGYFSYNEDHILPQTLIIVDEASMLDLFLANSLLKAINNHAKVIIVGDVDQLPSVGPGQVLHDFIYSSKIPTVYLNEIHRQAKDSKIITLARKVNEQNLSLSDLYSDQDVYLYQTQQDKILDILIKQVEGALEQGYSMIEDIQILAPMYKGSLGINRINEVMQEKFNNNKTKKMTHGDLTFYEHDKVIQLVNDPKRMVMNGNIGYVTYIGENDNGQRFMKVNFEDVEVVYEQNDLDELNLAYAISIHKSQGSEYKIIMMPVVRSFLHMLKKELIYTAMTRSKQYLIILGDMKLLVYASNQLVPTRQTSLAKRINDSLKLSQEDEEAVSPYDFM